MPRGRDCTGVTAEHSWKEPVIASFSQDKQALMRAFNTIHQSMRQSIKYLALAASVAIVTACHGLPEKTDETALWNNNKLYTEAQDALSGSDWGKCAKYF